jgi:hypothetical protein
VGEEFGNLVLFVAWRCRRPKVDRLADVELFLRRSVLDDLNLKANDASIAWLPTPIVDFDLEKG